MAGGGRGSCKANQPPNNNKRQEEEEDGEGMVGILPSSPVRIKATR